MQMDHYEILRSYKEALDPRKQITILAELNLCSRSRIIEILIERGVDPRELPKLPKYKSRLYAPLEKTALDQANAKSGARWVWNPNRHKPAAEVIDKAKARYEHLKLAHGELDHYVQGFKASIDFMEGK